MKKFEQRLATLEVDARLDAQIQAILDSDPIMRAFIEGLTSAELCRFAAGDIRLMAECDALYQDKVCMH